MCRSDLKWRTCAGRSSPKLKPHRMQVNARGVFLPCSTLPSRATAVAALELALLLLYVLGWTMPDPSAVIPAADGSGSLFGELFPSALMRRPGGTSKMDRTTRPAAAAGSPPWPLLLLILAFLLLVFADLRSGARKASMVEAGGPSLCGSLVHARGSFWARASAVEAVMMDELVTVGVVFDVCCASIENAARLCWFGNLRTDP